MVEQPDATRYKLTTHYTSPNRGKLIVASRHNQSSNTMLNRNTVLQNNTVHNQHNMNSLERSSVRTVGFGNQLRKSHGYRSVAAESNYIAEPKEGFDWDKDIQGLIFSSYLWGFVVSNIPIGLLCKRYGPRKVLFSCSVPVSILTMSAPFLANIHPFVLLTSRFVIGLGLGGFYTSKMDLLNRWIPISEQGIFLTLAFLGEMIGSALIEGLGGYICEQFGWPLIFYISGMFGLVWSVVWIVVVRDFPNQSPFISEAEKEYLQGNIRYQQSENEELTVPWRAVMTSLPFLSILVVHTCSGFGYWLLFIIPMYLSDVLHVSVTSNGIYQMLTFISQGVGLVFFGVLANEINKRLLLSCLNTRRLMSSLCMFTSGLSLLLLTMVNKEHTALAVVMICVYVGSIGASTFGFMVNHGDIAPRLAGVLFGVTATGFGIAGIVTPLVGSVITANQTAGEWHVVLATVACIHVFGGAVYVVCASGETQDWATNKGRDSEYETL